jgi:hypothetical protein
MAWSAEKFKLEEDEDEENEEEERDEEDRGEEEEQEVGGCATNVRNYVLAVCLADGNVVLLRSFDDVSPVTINTGLKPPLHAEWSNSWKLLAIAGIKDQEQQQHHLLQQQQQQQQQQHHHHYHTSAIEYTNLLKFYSDAGILIYTIVIPYSQVRGNLYYLILNALMPSPASYFTYPFYFLLLLFHVVVIIIINLCIIYCTR